MNRRRKIFLLIATLALGIFVSHTASVEFDFSSAANASDESRLQTEKSIKKISIDSKVLPSSATEATPANGKLVGKTLASVEVANKDLLCKLKSIHAHVPVEGDVKVLASRVTKAPGEASENAAWIKSKFCPEGMYSIVRFTDEGEMLEELDCRTASLTEIAAASGEQGNVNEASGGPGRMNLALSGNGYFVVRCSNGSLALTRDGQFQEDADGTLTNGNGCVLLSRFGDPMRNSAIGNSGCNSSGECVATLDPAFDEIMGLRYLNSYSFEFDSSIALTESVTTKGMDIFRPKFFVNSLEDVHNPDRGLTSVSWKHQPTINLQRLECF